MNISEATFQRLEADFNCTSLRNFTSALPDRQWIAYAEAHKRNSINLYPAGVIASRPDFDIKKMCELLDMNIFELRHSFYDLFKNPVFFPRYNESLAGQRARTIQKWRLISKTDVFTRHCRILRRRDASRTKPTLSLWVPWSTAWRLKWVSITDILEGP